MVCASLPAVRQLLMIILPSRIQAFFTNRSLSRSTRGEHRGQEPDAQRQYKGHSVFPVPTTSRDEEESFGVTTDISTSSWGKSQRQTLNGPERGAGVIEQQKSSFWNPFRIMFPEKTKSLQASFRSLTNRSNGPSSYNETNRRPTTTGVPTTMLRTEASEASGKASVDEQIELLRIPRETYQPGTCRDSEFDDITALPQVRAPPSHAVSWCSPFPRSRSNS